MNYNDPFKNMTSSDMAKMQSEQPEEYARLCGLLDAPSNPKMPLRYVNGLLVEGEIPPKE